MSFIDFIDTNLIKSDVSTASVATISILLDKGTFELVGWAYLPNN